MLLRSLQDISQPHIKCTGNALLIHGNDDDDDGDSVVVVIVIDDNGDNFKNEEKVQLQIDKKTSYILKGSYCEAMAIV